MLNSANSTRSKFSRCLLVAVRQIERLHAEFIIRSAANGNESQQKMKRTLQIENTTAALKTIKPHFENNSPAF